MKFNIKDFPGSKTFNPESVSPSDQEIFTKAGAIVYVYDAQM